jgi:hypothetical protein
MFVTWPADRVGRRAVQREARTPWRTRDSDARSESTACWSQGHARVRRLYRCGSVGRRIRGRRLGEGSSLTWPSPHTSWARWDQLRLDLLKEEAHAIRARIPSTVARSPVLQLHSVAFRTARVVMVYRTISRPGRMPHQHVGHVARRSGEPTRRSAASQNAVAHAAQRYSHRTPSPPAKMRPRATMASLRQRGQTCSRESIGERVKSDMAGSPNGSHRRDRPDARGIGRPSRQPGAPW